MTTTFNGVRSARLEGKRRLNQEQHFPGDPERGQYVHRGDDDSAGLLAFASGSLSRSSIIVSGDATLQWVTDNTEDISNRLVITNDANVTFDTNGNDVTLASGFGGSDPITGSITKTGDGTLILVGKNTYTGNTTMEALSK